MTLCLLSSFQIKTSAVQCLLLKCCGIFYTSRMDLILVDRNFDTIEHFSKYLRLILLKQQNLKEISQIDAKKILIFQIALLLAIFAMASGDLVRQGRHGCRLAGCCQPQGYLEA